MMDELGKLMDDFDKLLNKYSIDNVILVNMDDKKMGFRQLDKLINTDDGKFLVFSFSGKGKTLCLYCDEKEHHV
jgi:hypothetical protein